MLASVVESGGVVTVRGDATDDLITLYGNSTQTAFTVSVNNDAALTQTFQNTDISKVVVFGNAGNDSVFNTLQIPSEIYGNDGDDILWGGYRDDRLFGGPGDDIITGRSGDDYLSGFDGEDTLLGQGGNDTLFGGEDDDELFGNDGDDEINGQGGDDTIRGGYGDDVLQGAAGEDELHGQAGEDRLYGGNDNDLIYGGPDRDIIAGSFGNDILHGGGGDDYLVGNDGDDTIYGNDGEDNASGSNGQDILFGGDGNDRLFGNDGDDEINGQEGDDTIRGGNGDDQLLGSAGEDELHGEAGEDRLYGGNDNDVIYGGDDRDIISGSFGDDALHGEGGNDYLAGDAGDDRLFGQDGADTLFGHAGDDLLDGGIDQEEDRLTGGTGLDQFVVQGTIGSGSVDVVNDRAGFETYSGYNGQLTALAEVEGNQLIVRGLPGDNKIQIYARDGQDAFEIRSEHIELGTYSTSEITEVVITTGDGEDLIDNNNRSIVRMIVDTGAGNDRILGGRGDDILSGGDGNDHITGHDGDDFLRGNFGDDTLHGHDGDDILSGNQGNDKIYGDAGVDEINGGLGDDQAWGGSGNDFVGGNEGNDELRGNSGDDTLRGDAGADELWGNGGLDTFFADEFDDVRDRSGSEQLTMGPSTPPSSIGDLVFEDTNGNGVFDADETGISDVTLTLFLGTTAIATQTTDASGQYSFENLTVGDYRVELTTDLTFDYDLTTPTSVNVTLAEGQENNAIDFGAQPLPPGTGSIGDLVFEDEDLNGTLNNGELGLEGAEVVLLRSGTQIATTTSDASGNYLFSNLRAGEYEVSLNTSSLSGFTSTTDAAVVVQLSQGQQVDSADFGLARDIGDELNSLLGPAFAKQVSGLALETLGAGFRGVEDVSDTVKVVNVGDRSLFFTLSGVSFTGAQYQYGGDFPSTLNPAAAVELALQGQVSGGVIHVVSEFASGIEQDLATLTVAEMPNLANVVVRQENGDLAVVGALRYEFGPNFQFEPVSRTGNVSSPFSAGLIADEAIGQIGAIGLTALEALWGSSFNQGDFTSSLTASREQFLGEFLAPPSFTDYNQMLRFFRPEVSGLLDSFLSEGGRIGSQEMLSNSWSYAKDSFLHPNFNTSAPRTDIILIDPDVRPEDAADHIAYQLLALLNNTASAMHDAAKDRLEQDLVDRIIAGETLDLPGGTFPFNFLSTDAEIAEFDRIATTPLTVFPGIGTLVDVGELSTGKRFSFTVQNSIDLTTGDKLLIAGTNGLPFVAVLAKNVGGRILTRVVGTFDEAGNLRLIREASEAGESIIRQAIAGNISKADREALVRQVEDLVGRDNLPNGKIEFVFNALDNKGRPLNAFNDGTKRIHLAFSDGDAIPRGTLFEELQHLIDDFDETVKVPSPIPRTGTLANAEFHADVFQRLVANQDLFGITIDEIDDLLAGVFGQIQKLLGQ